METNHHTSLKDELEAEIQQTDSNRRNKFILAGCILFLLSIGVASLVFLLPRPAENKSKDSSSLAINESSKDSEATDEPKSDPKIPTDTPQPTDNTKHSPAITPQPSYTPSTSPIDKVAFKSLGHQVGASYAHIVELVTFPAGMSSADKSARIKQAYTLDKQHFNEVIGLRSMVNSASNTPPEYMAAVELAEAGVSAISVGVDGLNRWAENPNGASIEVSLGSVEKGARSLVQLSQTLNVL